VSDFACVVTVACVSALSECGQLNWIEPSPCTKHVTRGCGFVSTQCVAPKQLFCVHVFVCAAAALLMVFELLVGTNHRIVTLSFCYAAAIFFILQLHC
jgi:hypothetical protein